MSKNKKSKLKAKKANKIKFKKKILLLFLKLSFVGLVVLASISFLMVGYYSVDLPDISKIYEIKKQPTVTILDAEKRILANYGDLYGTNLKYKQIPQHLIQAVTAIEDRRFFTHFGIDPLGILRAFYENQKAGRVVQGGSTITQQLAKISFLTSERTLKRKIQEVLLAIKLEKKYSKEEILRIYLNRVYLGKGNYGVDAAARYYFGKRPEQLSLYESAMLAGMLKGPVRYSPSNNFSVALRRAKQVLYSMEEENYINENDLRAAIPPRIVERGNARGILKNPYFADYILEQISGVLDSLDQDISVYTTLNLELQNRLEQAVLKNVNEVSKKDKISQAAAIAIDNKERIVAMVGGVDYSKSQFNRAVNAKRQPGSAFKLFIYLAALEKGYTPSTIVEDSPIQIKKWIPRNFSRVHLGVVTFEEAFAKSLNTVAVKISEEVGRQNVIEVTRRLGIKDKITDVPSLALGSEVTSVLSLTAAYAHIASNGYRVNPYAIIKITDKNNRVIYEHTREARPKVISTEVIRDIKQLLAAVIQYGTGKKVYIPGEIYGKTGTSQDHRDAWFIGFDNNLTLGVWVGNDGNEPMNRVAGGTLPALIWKDFMQQRSQAIDPSIWNNIEARPGQQEQKSIFEFFSSIFSQEKKSETIDSIIEKNLKH